MAQGSATGGTISGLGTITIGHCAEWASVTQIEDSGAACGGGGGGGGTVTSITIAPTANQISVSGTCTITTTGTCTLLLPSAVILPGSLSVPGGAVSIGTDGSVAGLLDLSNNVGGGTHTIFGSAATTTNTILGPAAVIANGHVLTCATVGTVCTLTDGGASGSITGSGTTNTMAKFTAATAIGNSQVTDDGTHPVISPHGYDAGATAGYNNEVANNATTGTVLNALVCDDGTGHGIVCPTASSTTNQPYGSVTNNQGTSGNATFALLGFVLNYFDNQSTARDYAIASTTTAGYLHDTGSTTLTPGQPNYFVWTANTGANTTGYYRLLTADDFVVSSGTSALPGGSLYSLQYQSPLGTFAGNTPPTTNGNYLCGYNVTGSAALAPGCNLPGIQIDTTNPATLLYSDRAAYLKWTSGSALALPAIAGQFASQFPFVIQNTSGGTLTITPNAGASNLIDGSATGTVPNNSVALVYSDGVSNWNTIKFPNTAGGGGGGGGNPGGSGTNIQNRASSTTFGGIAGSSADDTNGLMTIAPTGTGVGLSIFGDAHSSDVLDLYLNGGTLGTPAVFVDTFGDLTVLNNITAASDTSGMNVDGVFGPFIEADPAGLGYGISENEGNASFINEFWSSTYDTLWADSTAHRWKFATSASGTTTYNVPGVQTAGTSGHLAAFASNGIDLADGGASAALSGTTGSIGGSLLTIGTCSSGTATVTGATTSMVASASPVTYPGDGNYWLAYVSASNTVTVKLCAVATLTPTASAYNVRVQ
jgi:hypothetical protein